MKGSMLKDIDGAVLGFSECENVGGGCGGDLTRGVHDRGVHALDVECRETRSVGAQSGVRCDRSRGLKLVGRSRDRRQGLWCKLSRFVRRKTVSTTERHASVV